MAQTSRRALLAGLAAGPAIVPPPATASTDEVGALFRRWLAQIAHYNGPALDGVGDDESAPHYAALTATERAITDLPPSLDSAAAALLIELSYGFTAETPDTLREAVRVDETGRIHMHVLAGLRPHLTGIVGALAADILDHPDRPLSASRLCTIRNGRAGA